MSDSIRGKLCYLCGEPFWHISKGFAEMELDRKPRKVHNDCKTMREKALKDLSAQGWAK